MKKLVVTLLSVVWVLSVLADTPQDQGLPYTRSAQKFALAKIADTVAVFAGSRYAYVHGYKVRLDDVNWHDEAMLRDGVIYVPATFAGVLSLKEVKPDAAPSYLADRWVYSLKIPKTKAPSVQIDGWPFVALADVARKLGLKVSQNPRGLLLIGENEISFSDAESSLLDSVITMFDTPEKLADPDIATKWIPTLAKQGKWTDHVKATPEQLKILAGAETKWPTATASEFDFAGFNKKLLGSKVPPPGVYPRVLFSPDDVPILAARVKNAKQGQKSLIEMGFLFKQSWWNPNSSDGRIFQKLANNDLAGLEWPDTPPTQVATINTAQQFKGEKPDIHNSHVAYVPECLTAMALYCLLTGDDAHGRQAATAIANYYKLREPLIDQYYAMSDTEFAGPAMGGNGASTAWRGMHGLVAHMNLGLSLDFAGKWMNAEQKETMRRVIAKATYGRRAYGEDSTVRFRDVNWVGWDLPQFLAVTSIEGLEGFDREAYETGAATVRAFCDWGIDDAGVVFESNGKTPGSFQFITLSMVSLARRGDNLFGHPHWRKLLVGQTEMTSPNGNVTVTSGTQYVPYSRQFLSLGLVDELKSFYPKSRVPDYLLTKATQSPGAVADETLRGWLLTDFDPANYREQVKHLPRLRLPSATYPGFVPNVLYDGDYQPTTRAELNLPLDFNAPVQGVFSSYSDRTTNAAWINIMVRPNHYLGAGHHHADAGMFHFSALGVDWFTQSPFTQEYAGKYFNLVQVDGESEPFGITGINGYNGAAKYLGSTATDGGATGSADLTYAYSYRWLTQPPQVWSSEIEKLGWELEPSAENLKIFVGTERYKMRPWWPAYTYENYIPTCRAPFNPMQRVFRTVGLVRGAKPYGFVVDDLKKDGATHLYQWTAMLNGGVWQADVPDLAPNQVALAYRARDPSLNSATVQPAIAPQPGEPLLLVCVLGMADSGDAALPLVQVARSEAMKDNAGKSQYFDRVVINHRAVDANFRVVLAPFRAGEPLPQISLDAKSGIAKVTAAGQRDEINFSSDADQRTQVSVTRGGKKIVESK